MGGPFRYYSALILFSWERADDLDVVFLGIAQDEQSLFVLLLMDENQGIPEDRQTMVDCADQCPAVDCCFFHDDHCHNVQYSFEISLFILMNNIFVPDLVESVNL